MIINRQIMTASLLFVFTDIFGDSPTRAQRIHIASKKKADKDKKKKRKISQASKRRNRQ